MGWSWNTPVPLVCVEVCLQLVQHGPLQLEEVSTGSLRVGSNYMKDKPFLVLACRYYCVPFFDLLFDSSSIDFVVGVLRDIESKSMSSTCSDAHLTSHDVDVQEWFLQKSCWNLRCVIVP